MLASRSFCDSDSGFQLARAKNGELTTARLGTLALRVYRVFGYLVTHLPQHEEPTKELILTFPQVLHCGLL